MIDSLEYLKMLHLLPIDLKDGFYLIYIYIYIYYSSWVMKLRKPQKYGNGWFFERNL